MANSHPFKLIGCHALESLHFKAKTLNQYNFSEKLKMNFIVEYNKNSLALKDVKPDLTLLKEQIETLFSLKPLSYKLCYLDTEEDPIMVEDDDDLAVCILEFSEASKVDDPVKLLVMAEDAQKSPVLSPRGSFKKIAKSDIMDKDLIVDLDKKETLTESKFNDNESVISEKVISTIESRLTETIDKKMEDLFNEKVMKEVDRKLCERINHEMEMFKQKQAIENEMILARDKK